MKKHNLPIAAHIGAGTCIPQTDFTKQIQVNAYEAKEYITTLERDLRIWSDFESDTAKARVQITQQHLDSAKKLLGL